MLAELTFIPVSRLAIILLPVALVIVLHWHWSLKAGEAAIATGRMLLQLLLIGYVLTFIFETHHPTIVAAVLSVMLLAASWIALRGAKDYSRAHFLKVLGSIALGGGVTMILVTQGVLALQPWFDPHKVVPLGGMAFAGAMNAVALASERFASETRSGAAYTSARRTAMRAAMIPTTNSMLAVGLVSIPRRDDRPGAGRHRPADRRPLPDHGDGNGLQLRRPLGGGVPPADAPRGRRRRSVIIPHRFALGRRRRVRPR